MELLNFFYKKRNKENNKKIKKLEHWLKDSGNIKNYTTLKNNPDIKIAINKIADLISSMTIKLYQNTDNGDIRIKNELAKKIDISPNNKLTRKSFIYLIVSDLLTYGNAYAIVTHQDNGNIDEIIPINYNSVIYQNGIYKIDSAYFEDDEILHFVLHPDFNNNLLGKGLNIELSDVINSLNIANETKNAFLKNKFNPSIIIKVDADDELFKTPEGQNILYNAYLSATDSGTPFFVPSELFEIETIKPLTLNDIALIDNIKLDKKTIANFIGLPPFMLGVGEYNQQEYNNFINQTILPLVQAIEQELTKKILYSNELYFKFNIFSLYQFDIQNIASMGIELFKSGIVTGNEVRNLLQMTPMNELNTLTILENYIPLNKIDKQEKIKN